MENLKNEIKKESAEDSLILYQANLLQIKLADELGYDLQQFVDYFSSQFRRMFENNLNKQNPLKTDFEELYSIIKLHFIRNNFSLKIKDIVEF